MITAGIGVLGIVSATLAFAWNEPTAAPPGNNAPAPINVGTTNQVKNGRLGVNALAVFGSSLFGGSTGSNAYLNFGATSGESGYGIRDNAGLLEFKNSGGNWQSIQNILYTMCGGECGGRVGWVSVNLGTTDLYQIPTASTGGTPRLIARTMLTQ